MLRICAAVAAIAAVPLTVGIPAQAFPGHSYPEPRSSGMAAEFPVGICMDVTDDLTIDYMNIINVAAVPCTDPARNYRVTQHVPNEPLCGSDTNRVFHTRDSVVLCAVQDS
jgi:hypothetical protein